MASSRGRTHRSINVWPGYVDALATLLLSVVFLLTIFVVGQFFLSQELTGRDEVLNRLNRQIADLTDLLALERSNRRTQEETAASLKNSLERAECDRDRLQALNDAAQAAKGQSSEVDKQLEAERGATAHITQGHQLRRGAAAALSPRSPVAQSRIASGIRPGARPCR